MGFTSIIQLIQSSDDYLAHTIKKFGAPQGGDAGDINTNLILNFTGHIKEIRKNDLLKWFELELLSAQFPNGRNYIGGLSVSPGEPENTLTQTPSVNAYNSCVNLPKSMIFTSILLFFGLPGKIERRRGQL